MKKQKPFTRASGVLLSVSSLPSPYGIGTLGAEAFRFVDFLKKAGQSYWQVLPITPVGAANSPYQSFSAFAGNPLYIDPDILAEEGILAQDDLLQFDWGNDPEQVDYEKVREARLSLLKLAFSNSNHAEQEDYRKFCAENEFWLEDYSCYMALRESYGGESWENWPREVRMREKEALSVLHKNMETEIEFWKFCQFHFFKQWEKLKLYANGAGVRLIGDLPIYVSMDSADTWVNRTEFLLDADGKATEVAGVPPDYFSEDGQLWGNPIYHWEKMEKNGFRWWRRRMAFSAKLFDVIRIDHFIGLVRYYSIPAKEVTARNGKWHPGPGAALLEAFSEELGECKLIAEDLGVVTPAVTRLRERAGYPGMKLMIFAFQSDSKNENLPHNLEKNCVLYGGTHDNETLAGYLRHVENSELLFMQRYLKTRLRFLLPREMLRVAYASVANLVIFQMQDLLGLDNRARMNLPASTEGNWQWRMKKDAPTDRIAKELYELCDLYGRLREDTDHGTV